MRNKVSHIEVAYIKTALCIGNLLNSYYVTEVVISVIIVLQ